MRNRCCLRATLPNEGIKARRALGRFAGKKNATSETVFFLPQRQYTNACDWDGTVRVFNDSQASFIKDVNDAYRRRYTERPTTAVARSRRETGKFRRN